MPIPAGWDTPEKLSGYSAMKKIFHSDAVKQVKFCSQRRCWVTADTNSPLSGVRRLLKERLWPHYDYKLAERLNPTPRNMRVLTGVRSARGGSNRGSAVHEQLHAIVSLGYSKAVELYASKHITMEPLAIDLLRDFHRRGWRLVCAELPVYDERPELRVGSSIDLVCVRRENGALIFFELKVGGDNYREKASGIMENELRPFAIGNSPLNQALMQLLAYRALFTRCYGDIVKADEHIDSWQVVFIGLSGVAYRPLTPRNVRLVQTAVISSLKATGSSGTIARNNKRRRGQ